MTTNYFNNLKIWLIAGIFLVVSFPGNLFALTGETPSSAAVGQDAPALTYTVTATLDEDGNKTDELLGKSEAGQTLWAVSHPSVQRGASLHGPVLNGQAWIYALGGDVLELDRDGHVVKRTPYPATIGDLRLDGEKVWVTLESQRGSDTESVGVLHTGKTASRGPWGSFPFVALRLSQDLPPETRETLGPSEWGPVLLKLLEAEKVDLTNPILSAYVGLAYAILENETEADAAFDRARHRSLNWSDDLMVCGVLERAHRGEQAAIVCGRAVGRMREAGVRPEALWSPILLVSTTVDLQKAMALAFEAKDLETVNRIAGYQRAAFPNVGGAEHVWSSLADWFAKNGATDKARTWKSASDEARSDDVSRMSGSQNRTIDLWLLFGVAAYLGVLLAGLIFGIRSERRTPGNNKWITWLPTPTLLESVSLLVFTCAVFTTSFMATREIALITSAIEMPLSAATDGLAAPEVVTWLDGFDTTPMVSELRHHSKQELEFLKAGLPVTSNPPRVGLTLDIIGEQAMASEGKYTAFWDSLALLSNLYMFLLFFSVIGRFGARLLGPNNKVFMLVPGVALGPFGVWCATAIAMGILYMATPINSILSSVSTPVFGTYYGLGALSSKMNLKPDMNAMIVLLVLGLVLHVVSVVWDLKHSSREIK